VQSDGKTPATDFTIAVVEAMVARGVLLNRIGRHGNTLKMRPPMPFAREDADIVVDALIDALAHTPIMKSA